MTSPSNEPAAGDLLAAALAYALDGLPVLPLHDVTAGCCSCHDGADCRTPGKHPRLKDWRTTATTDAGLIARWWASWPTANVGVLTGARSGVVVLDVDPRHGGLAALETLQRKHGRLPRTAQVLTGSGGQHWYFKHPGGELRNSAGVLGDGLDVRGDGGYAVAPPSVHENGKPYKWLRGLEHAVDCPQALAADAQKRRNGTTAKIDEIIPEGKRRHAMLTVAGKLKRAGLTGDEILPTLRELNKRCHPPLDDTELESVAFESTIAPDPESAIPTVQPADPRPLEDVLATFRRWLYLPDPAPVLITCAVLAANGIEGFDPTWLVLVGSAGSGKTEALHATTSLDGVYLVGTLTEASLLSGTPRKDTAASASGGLLREIGTHGIVVLKDFGSVLSMPSEPRARVLAALREIYDGSWQRDIGVDGGRRLQWEGRLGLLAGATTVLDQHHGVMAQLGERFLLHRIAVADARAQGRASLAHHGRERMMRRELAEAVAGLFTGLELEPPPLSEADESRLVDLAVLVSRARSPVVRDSYRREIELVPDSEAPARIVGALARTLTGLRMIGVDEREAWRLTTKTGLDSMPAGRLRTLEYLLTRSDAETTTTDVATVLGLPNPTTHRTLSDLAAHGVIARESQGQGKPDLWRIEPWTAARYHAATTSSEMSGPTLI
jgi:hypothetical protein